MALPSSVRGGVIDRHRRADQAHVADIDLAAQLAGGQAKADQIEAEVDRCACVAAAIASRYARQVQHISAAAIGVVGMAQAVDCALLQRGACAGAGQLNIEQGIAVAGAQVAIACVQQVGTRVGVLQGDFKRILRGGGENAVLLDAVGLQVQTAYGEGEEAVLGAEDEGLGQMGIGGLGAGGFAQGSS